MSELYSQTQTSEGTRKSIFPSRLTTFLPEGSSYVTPTLAANTWEKIQALTNVKYIRDFEYDVINERYFLSTEDIIDRTFNITSTASVSSSTANHMVEFAIFKNGVIEDGIYIKRWIAAGADTGSIAISGAFTLSSNDYIDTYIKDSTNGTVTFETLSINIIEDN